MKAAFVLFCLVLCLSLIRCQDGSLMTKLSVYDCYDPDPQNTEHANYKLGRSGVILPSTKQEFHYTENGIKFLSDDGKYVGLFNLRMYCIKTRDSDAYAFTGSYSGKAFDKNKNEVTIETTKITPMLTGRIVDGRVGGNLVNSETFSINDGAPLEEFSFYMLKNDVLGCSYEYNPFRRSEQRGCVSLSDYNPNVQKKINSETCTTVEDEDPVQRDNCGPPMAIKKTDEIVTSVEETISTESTASTTLEIGETFKITAGVEIDGGVASASAGFELELASSSGLTQERSHENARSASTVRSNKIEREYTLEHGNRLIEYKNRKVCTAKGTAFGCFDNECSLSFKLDYKQETTFLNERAEMTSIVCSATV